MPQVEHAGGTISDTTSWTLVTGTHVAAGGEEWVTIGNFRDDATTTVTGVPCCGGFGAYYFLDDVSVRKEGQQPPCLWRADASEVHPLTPPPSTLFVPETPDGISIAGPSWQCPIASGDVDRDASAAGNGVPLAFYQVDRRVTLRVQKSGTTLRFTF